tara:strand:- start:10 stop:735 length:726 start_codon:yes stop_codon:yes gene_type:complete
MKDIGKIILITGSGRRIGKELVLGLSKIDKNYKFILHYNNSSKEVQSLINKIKKDGISAKPIKFNLLETEKIESFAHKAEKLYGRIDVLINNASIFKAKKFNKISSKDLDEMINVNLKAPFLLSKFISSQMVKRKNGKIINFTDSIGVTKTWKDYSHYCISKGGLETMTKVMSLELAPYVQVNSIAPGKILKPINSSKNLYNNFYNSNDAINDIVNTVYLLVESKFINGESFKVDNGESLT